MTALLIAWLIMLLPVLQLVPNSQSYVNERCFYLTLVFPVYFVALLLRKLLSKQRIVLLSYSLLVIFSLLTFNQSGRWKNTETLFGYELSLDNKNCTALNILGYYYNSTGEYEKAKSLLARALVIDSLDASSLNNYGWSLYATGKTAEAISLLKKSLLLKNNFLEAHNNLGLCYLRCEEKEKALEQFRIAEQISPGQKDVMFNLGIIYYHTSDRSLGLTYLRKAAARGHERAREFLKKCDTHNLTSGK
jgi:Flp pilus assembly protein TadD